MKRYHCSCSEYLVFAMLPVVITGCCEKIPIPDNEELLTSVVWGETNATITDPELYTCVFEPSGNYYTTYRGYETATFTWQLINDITLMFGQSPVEITRLTPGVLEYRGDAVILGIHYKQTYHLQALKETVATTLGFSDLGSTSAQLHGIIRSCSPCGIVFEYGPTSSYGQANGRTEIPGPVHKPVSTGLTGLTPGTTYHYRLKLENEEGTFYGADRMVRTYTDQTLTDADNNEYYTAVIGSQTWMAQNLRTTKYKDGTAIARVTETEAWSALTTPAFCWSDNDSVHYSAEGAIYNWYAVSTSKLCPAGWHVPSASEWSVLFSSVTGREAGLIEGEFGYYNDFLWTSGVNQTGFSAEMARMRSSEGYFGGNNYSHFWTSSESNSDEAGFAMMYFDYTGQNKESKRSGYQVRCLKD